MEKLIAQHEVPIGPQPVCGIGTLGFCGGGDAAVLLSQVLSTTIGLLTVIAALYFMFMLITGAIGIIGSGGDKAAYANARSKLTTGAIGFVAVIAGMFIMSLISTILGLPNILNLREMINTIRLP